MKAACFLCVCVFFLFCIFIQVLNSNKQSGLPLNYLLSYIYNILYITHTGMICWRCDEMSAIFGLVVFLYYNFRNPKCRDSPSTIIPSF